MNHPDYQRLLETSWRRPLTPEEQARLEALLAGAPAARPDWQAEAALTHVLARLPEPPLASNFTAQVLRVLPATPPAPVSLAARWQDWLRVFWPKVAWAAVALVVGAAAVQSYGHWHRARLVRDLASIPVVPAVPSPEILQDFDAIQEFSHVPSAPVGLQAFSDEALLTALQ